MNGVVQFLKGQAKYAADAWDQFWFTPAEPHTMAFIRLLSGSMLFYTHLVWTINLAAFLGPNAWISNEVSQELAQNSYVWTYWWWVESVPMLWAVHLVGLVVIGMYAVGYKTRITSVLSWLIAVSYCHRLISSMFGLDQVNTMCVMYLMLCPAGAVYSVDRWLENRRAGGKAPEPAPRVSTNIATRLLQIHLAIVYLFGGIGKMRGELWWDGSAAWYAFAIQEYQSLDMTWMIHFPWLIALITHVTVFWETFYFALVWNRHTRWLAIAMAFVVHGSIAICLGMITFGLAMIFVNLSFISPPAIKATVAWLVGLFRPARPAGTLANQPART